MTEQDRQKIQATLEALEHLKAVLPDHKFQHYLDMAIRRGQMVLNNRRRKRATNP